MVQRAKVLFPQCRMAAADADVMQSVLAGQGDLMDKYGTAVDRLSAYETIEGQNAEAEANAKLAAERAAFEKEKAEFEAQRQKEAQKAERERQKAEEKAAQAAQREQERQQRQLEREAEAAAKREVAEQARAEREAQRKQEQMAKQVGRFANSILGTFGREATRQLTRGLFNSLKRR